MVDDGWSVYDVVRNDNETAISLCVINFQSLPKRREIYILSSPIALKSDRRLGNNFAKLHMSYFKVDYPSILRHKLTALDFKIS